MKLILGGLNGQYLRAIVESAAKETEQVLAAVAYASKEELLFDWCWKNSIPLRFWGRLDEDVAVQPHILKAFLDRKSPNYICKLVQHHHAKVIWWQGYGLYIGSANLTDRAWYTNIEAGCFWEESEIDDTVSNEVNHLFQALDKNATPLTQELYDLICTRANELQRNSPKTDFWSRPSVNKWSGLVHTAPKKARDRQRDEFLTEWHATLQELRSIGSLVSQDQYRPSWVSPDAPPGAQADQFLHAHYYERTFDGKRADYERHYANNRANKQAALDEAMLWWSKLSAPPGNEAEMLNIRAPFLEQALSREGLKSMTFEQFEAVCERVYAFVDYARRVKNTKVSLPDTGAGYSIEQKTRALASQIWGAHTAKGHSVQDVLSYILYGGPSDELPSRLYDAVYGEEWKMELLGVSILGEIVGWAQPDLFPPRNRRTSKSLRSLGFEVSIH